MIKFVRNSVLSTSFLCVVCFRRYKGIRYKPNTAKVRQLKNPTALALDHFDFYYAPLFGKKWPSVRLGLLTPNKFVAILNRFSKDLEMNQKIIKELGTMDLIDILVKGMETMSDRVEKMKQASEAQLNIQSQTVLEDCEDIVDIKHGRIPEPELEKDDLSMRLDFGIDQFRESSREFGMHELKHGFLNNTSKTDRRVRDEDFKVTGLEGMSVESLPFVDDFIYYPRDLKLSVFGRGCLDSFPCPIKDASGVSSWWLLDGGSILPVLALDLKKGDLVLDMCAAPGGKSLLIAQTQKFERLVCNDMKLERLGVLRRSLAMYIPNNCEEANKITIKRKDASNVETWDELEVYDKVLVDAPCSTDRLSATQDEGNLFLSANTLHRLNLPMIQTRLLVNALRSVKVGGQVVYSTCSLSPSQNECVVENAAALAHSYYGIRCAEKSLKPVEKHLSTTGLYKFHTSCKRGILNVPYLLSNFGPMYTCKLQRIR